MVKSRRDESTEDRKRQRKERAAQADYEIGYCKTNKNNWFKRGNQAARKTPKPPADHDWSAPDVADPKKRPRSFKVTDPADVGADMLEEPVPYTINGKRTKVPFIYAALDQLRKDILTGSRRDRTESMRMYITAGAFERLGQRQYLRARDFEMTNRAWWERRMQGLKKQVLHAASKGKLTDDKAWDEILDFCLFEGEEDRLAAEFAKDAAEFDADPSGASAEDDMPIAAEFADNCAAEDIASDDSETTESLGSEVGGSTDDAADHLMKGKEEPSLEPAAEIDVGTDPDIESASPAVDDQPAHSTPPPDAGSGPKGALWTDYVVSGSNPASSQASSEPPDSAEVEQEPDPPTGHPSDMTSFAKEGEIIFWAKQGNGYQQIRNKAGWNHGPRTKH